MNAPINIYAAVVFDLPQKLIDYIGQLDTAGQIDHDEHDQPYLLKVEKKGSNYHCFIVRNGKEANFIINTRKRRDPVLTWNAADGYKRKDPLQHKIVQTQAPLGARQERARRTVETWERLVGQILKE